MLVSFSEFKFYQSFRIPVEEADDIRFLVEMDDGTGKDRYVDARLVDLSVTGLGFSSKEKLSVGMDMDLSLQFKKIHLDLPAKVVRAFSSVDKGDEIIYGVEFEDETEVRKFIESFINSFSNERLKDCLIRSSLQERYSSVSEGFEMLSLLLSIFKDLINFSDREDFVDSLLGEVVRLLNAQKAVLYLINPDKNELEAIAALGFKKEDLKFDYRQGVAGSVFTTGVSLNLDVKSDKKRFELEFDESVETELSSIICNPIQNREDKNIGVLQVINKKTENRFSVEDEKTMKVLSLVFSTIFHNFNPMSDKSRIRRFSAPFDRQFALIGRSTVASRLRGAIVKLKDIDCPLYIHGEHGTGKSLLGQIIHIEGRRGLNRFEKIHCGGVEADDFEGLIFGIQGKTGLIDECRGGSLLLHEVHLLPLNLQKKMYEKFKNNKLDDSDSDLNIRLMVTSTEDLEELMEKGEFNREFYEYVAESYIHVEALRTRREDVKYLVEYFMKKACKEHGLLIKQFTPRAMDTFEKYDWPGNVKELKRCVERAVLYNPKAHIIGDVASGATPLIDKSKSVLKAFEDLPHVSDSEIPLKERLLLVEKKLIEAEIKKQNGNKSKAAKIMGISREALRKKLISSGEITDRLDATDKKAA